MANNEFIPHIIINISKVYSSVNHNVYMGTNRFWIASTCMSTIEPMHHVNFEPFTKFSNKNSSASISTLWPGNTIWSEIRSINWFGYQKLCSGFHFWCSSCWTQKCMNHIWTTEPIINIISTCIYTGQEYIENIFLPKTLKFIICVKKILFIRKSMVYYQTLLLCTFTQLKSVMQPKNSPITV